MRSLGEYVGSLVERISSEDLAASIEHTLLRPGSTARDLVRLVEEAEHHGFHCIVVPPILVREASSITKLPVCTVVGFPNGYETIRAKLVEVEEALSDGASGIDAVWNISAYKSRRLDYVEKELKSIVNAVKQGGAEVKIIVETSLLTPSEIVEAARLIKESGADFIKTNTGFGPRGVSLADVVFIRTAVRGSLRIKAAGGIRDALTALLLLDAGAERLGASHSVQIMQSYEELKQQVK